MSVLCLITNPTEPALTSEIVEKIHHQIGGDLNWLSQGIACEIAAPKSTTPLKEAQQIIGSEPIDVALIPRVNRRKSMLIADMDSTMINEECIDELADALGLKDQVADITARAMNGELDFAEALDTRVALLKGLNLKAIKEVRRERITLANGGRALVQTMKAYGAHTVLISGGFTFFADHIAKRVGFEQAIANELLFDGDELTGKVGKPIVDKNTKIEALERIAMKRDIPIAQTLAVGDGANDLPMLQGAGLGVALHAKPSVAAEARVRIDHGDLTALLFLQGYSDEEIVR